MNKKKLVALFLAATTVSTMVFAGCGSTEEKKETSTEKTDDTKPDKDQTLNLVGYDYTSLDPAQVSDTESFTSMNQVFEGLMREQTDIKGNTKIVNAGAEKVDVSSDKKTYTFHLRKDAKWTDDKPVTAKDYVYAWKRLINPTTAAPYMTILAELNVKGAQEIIDAATAKKDKATTDALVEKLGVEAKDDYTFEVKLAKPTPYFLNAMTFKGLVPVREDKVKAAGDKYGADINTVVYNGPFTISDYQKGSKIVYKKNPKYWNAKNIKLETANGFIIDESNTLVKMFESGELDLTGASKDNLARLKEKAKNGEITYIHGKDTTSYYEYFNVTKGILKNAKVRKALSLAINRQEYLDVVYKRMIPAYGLITDGVDCSGSVYRKEVPEPIKNDVEEAKKLMTEGLKEEGVDASKVVIKDLLGTKTSTTSAIGDYMEKLYKDTFGIKLEQVFTPDSKTFFKLLNEGDFDIASSGWGPDYDDISSFFGVFLSDSANNNGHYKNPKYDELVKKAASEEDAKKRVELYKEAEKILVADDAGIMPSYYADINSFRKNYVKGSTFSKFGGQYDLSQVYISGKTK